MFLTIFNYFRHILVAFKYFVQSDWLFIVQNLELPYNAKLKTQVVTDRVPSGFKWDSCCSIFSYLNSFLLTTVYHFVLFRLAIALPALLRFMTSDHPFGTFLICWPILSQLSNLIHCNLYVKIYWRLQLFGIMNFLMVKD